MSSFDPHKYRQSPGHAARVVARGDYSQAHFQALEDLKKHLGETDDSSARAVGNVRGMQDQVAAFGAALAADRDEKITGSQAGHESADDQTWRDWKRSERSRRYEARIAQGLSDLSAALAGPQPQAKPRAGARPAAPVALDEPSQEWIARHFAQLRDRLDATLASDKSGETANEALKRIAALEKKLDEIAARQVRGGRDILAAMDARLGEFARAHLAKLAERADIDKLHDSLSALHHQVDGSARALAEMRRDTERLAVRTGAAVVRQTAALTAKRVAGEIRFPVGELERLDGQIGQCLKETRALGKRTEILQHSLHEGVADLRNRVSLLIAATPRGQGSLRQRIDEAAHEDDGEPVDLAGPSAYAARMAPVEHDNAGHSAPWHQPRATAPSPGAPDPAQTIRPDAIRDRHFAYEFSRRQQRDRANRLALVGIGLVAALLAAAGCLWLYVQIIQPKAAHSGLTTSAIERANTTIIIRTPPRQVIYTPAVIALSGPAGRV
jgi:hypothetical protein